MPDKANLWPAALAGFDLIRKRPLAVLIWGLVVFALTYGPMLLVFGLGAENFMEFFEAAASESGEPSEAEVAAFFGFFFAMMGAALFTLIGSVIAYVVVYTAIWRSVLFPDQGRFAYLRFGKTEGRVFLIMLILYALYYVASLIPMNLAMIPLMANWMIAMETHMADAGTVDEAAMAEIFRSFLVMYGQMFVVILVVSAALAWPFLRLAMALPMSIAENRMRIFEGWAFTRGYGWRLWGMYIAAMAMSGLVFLLIGGVTAVLALNMMGFEAPSDIFSWVTAADPEAAFLDFWERALGTLWLAAVSSFVMVTLTQVIVYAPLARAYQLIADARGDGPRTANV